MPLRPQAQKYSCKQCGFSRIHQPKSDCLDASDLKARICPKCNTQMEQSKASALDSALYPLLHPLQTLRDSLKK